MLKYIKSIILIALVSLSLNSFSQKTAHTTTKWHSFEEAEVLMKKNPKKIFIDIYTDWCGWCKRMDATTFDHPAISALLNEYYYPVKLNAEQRDTIRALGREFPFMQNANGRGGINQLAAELMQGGGGYPTTCVLGSKFEYLEKIPGYKDAQQMEYILRFYIADAYTSQEKALEFQKNYIPTIAGETPAAK